MGRAVTALFACLVSFAAGAGMMRAQEGQAASRREPQFENEYLQVWKSIVMPKQPLTLHRHDHGRALVALTNGDLKVVDKGGKLLHTYHLEKGKAYWLAADPPGQLHADVNDASRPIEVVVVQLKQDK
ncbi:MAG TPA: hypothetical protein VII52_08650 [Gemmatimonadaceae bacterium]